MSEKLLTKILSALEDIKSILQAKQDPAPAEEETEKCQWDLCPLSVTDVETAGMPIRMSPDRLFLSGDPFPVCNFHKQMGEDRGLWTTSLHRLVQPPRSK